MNKIDPMGLANEARRDATTMLGDMQRTIKNEIVTQPAVAEKVPRHEERLSYLKVRNNPYEIDALAQQYGPMKTIQMLKEQEQKLQRDVKGGRYDDGR